MPSWILRRKLQRRHVCYYKTYQWVRNLDLFIMACRILRNVEWLILIKQPSYTFWWMNRLSKLSRDVFFWLVRNEKENIGRIIDIQPTVEWVTRKLFRSKVHSIVCSWKGIFLYTSLESNITLNRIPNLRICGLLSQYWATS